MDLRPTIIKQNYLGQVSSPTVDNSKSQRARVDYLERRLDSQYNNSDSASVVQPSEKNQRLRSQLTTLDAELDELDRKGSHQFRDSTLTSGQSIKEGRMLVNSSEVSMLFDINSMIRKWKVIFNG